MIDGVKVTLLRQMVDERGKVMHMIRSDDDVFSQFGEIYFSCIFPGAVKAWKLHKEMTMNCAVPHGDIKFVLYDARENSETKGAVQELFMGPNHYFLLTVPPMIWTGFKCIGTETALLANCATIPHARHEFDRCDENHVSIPYDWA